MELSKRQLEAIKRVEARLDGEKKEGKDNKGRDGSFQNHPTKNRKYFVSRTPEILHEHEVKRTQGAASQDPNNQSVAELRKHTEPRKGSGSETFDKDKLSALIERLTGIPGSKFITENSNKALFLDGQQTNTSLSAKKRKRKRRHELDLKSELINRKKRREVTKRVYEKITYSMLIQVNELWHKYADNLFGVINGGQQQPHAVTRTCSLREALQSCEILKGYTRLIKQLEFHGCEITAHPQSQDTTIEGFVFRNGKNTFSLVTKANKVKIVPKKGTEFSFEVNGSKVRFWGDQII